MTISLVQFILDTRSISRTATNSSTKLLPVCFAIAVVVGRYVPAQDHGHPDHVLQFAFLRISDINQVVRLFITTPTYTTDDDSLKKTDDDYTRGD